MKKKALMLFLIITRNGSFQGRDDQKVFVQDCHTVGLMGNKAFTLFALEGPHFCNSSNFMTGKSDPELCMLKWSFF